MFSTLVPCLFAAYLHGGLLTSHFDYQPVEIKPSQCKFKAYIAPNNNLTLILMEPKVSATTEAQIRVEIPMPKEDGWKRFQYWWGSDRAYIEGREVFIKHGPTAMY